MTTSDPLPLPGKLVDVGGFRLHYVLHGEAHPGPTVVLERGIAGDHLAWFAIEPQIAAFAPVLSYDRAGLGWSDHSPHSRAPDQVARELHALLTRAGIAGPYLLVGNSMGGIHVRHFAQLYPDTVCGMVFVDSAHTQWPNRMSPAIREIFDSMWETEMAELEHLTTLTHPEIVAHYQEKYATFFGENTPLPPDVLELYFDRMLPEIVTEMLREFQGLEAVYEAGEPPVPVGDLPLVVLTATGIRPDPDFDDAQNAELRQLRVALQAELVALSTQSTHINVDCGHLIYIEEPAIVVDAIRSLVEKVRGV